jgi:mannose-6-phosphate isomerase-like protein (cupin superfamily)
VDNASVSRLGDVYENRVTGELAVVLRGDEDGPGQPGLVHLTVRPHGAVVGEHVHPRMQERFRVISGRLGTRIGGVERTLTAGEEVIVPPWTPHDWWNSGETNAGVLIELSPPDPRFEALIGSLFGLANAGRTNAKGRPNPFQLALIAEEFDDVIRFTKPPPVVQQALLGAIGRRRGYRASYPEYLRPHRRTTPDPEVLSIAGVTPPPR